MRQVYNYEKFQILVTDEESDEFSDLQEEMAIDQTHPLWKNYFNIDLGAFDLYAITIINGKPLGFQACQTKDIWNGASRAMTRTYLHKNATHLYKEIGVENTKLYGTVFKDIVNRPFFISREMMRTPEIDWRSFNYFCKWMKNGTNMPLHWDNNVYQMSKESWQFIVWLQKDTRNIASRNII